MRYPSRRAFADMIAEPDYAVADPVRTSALAEAVLQPTRSLFWIPPWTTPSAPSARAS